MKRKPVKLERKAWKYDNMYPQFVSVVETGANFIPFSSIKFSEDLGEQLSEGYDIAKIEFSLSFSESDVVKYLDDKQIVDYVIQLKEDGSMYVENPDIEHFSDLEVISMSEGVNIYVGKTSKATNQVKTKIEEYEPASTFSEGENQSAEEASVALASEETEEAPETETTEDISETEEDTITEDVAVEGEVLEVDNVEAEPVDETSEVVVQQSEGSKIAQAILNFHKLKMSDSDNEFLHSVDARKAYITIDLLNYQFLDTVYYALLDDDRETKIKEASTKFADAVLKVYQGLSLLSMSADYDDEDEEDIDQTGATIIGEEEPLVLLSDTAEDNVDSIKNTLESLQNEILSLKDELTKINATKTVDSEKVLMQTTKADVSVFDKGSTLEETNKPSALNKSTKNLLGL